MSRFANLFRACMAKGLSPDDAAEIVEMVEEGFATPVPEVEALALRRAADRERQRALRERKEAEKGAASRDSHVSPEIEPRACSNTKPPSEVDIPPVRPKGLPAPKGAERRGERLPADWKPDIEAALAVGLTEPEALAQAERFRDYWRGVPGAKGRKADWPATWRNWCRRALENQPRKTHERPDPTDRKRTQLETAFTGAQVAAQRRNLERAGG